jgi:hypothetical protein
MEPAEPASNHRRPDVEVVQLDGGRVLVAGELDAVSGTTGGAGAADSRLRRADHMPVAQVGPGLPVPARRPRVPASPLLPLGGEPLVEQRDDPDHVHQLGPADAAGISAAPPSQWTAVRLQT